MCGGGQTVEVNGSQADLEFTIDNIDNLLAAFENTVEVWTLERFLLDKVATERGNLVETVETLIQKAISAAMDNTITPRKELAVS